MGEQDQRLGFVFPADGEDALPDGKTKSTRADLSVTATDWGDTVQAILSYLNGNGGEIGDVANRPAAGTDGPRFWLSIGATDAAPTLYYNDEGANTWAAVSSGDADTLDGLDSTQFLRSDASDAWKGSTLTLEGPDDTSGTVAIRPGADTADAGTPSIDATIEGDITHTSGTVSLGGPVTVSDVVTIDTGGTGTALDLSTGDLTGVDDLYFSTAANPLIQDLGLLSGGIAGTDANGNRLSISSLWGDAQEYVQLGSTGSGAGTPSTTSTTYTAVLNNSRRGVVPADKAKPTNIGTYAISGLFGLANDTAGETTYARVIDETNATALTGTEVTHTGTGSSIHHTPIVNYDPGTAFEFNVEVKVTAGTGTVSRNPTVVWWGQIA